MLVHAGRLRGVLYGCLAVSVSAEPRGVFVSLCDVTCEPCQRRIIWGSITTFPPSHRMPRTHAMVERLVTSIGCRRELCNLALRDKLNQESPNALGKPGQVGDPLAPHLAR
jgi:hypothetical protein